MQFDAAIAGGQIAGQIAELNALVQGFQRLVDAGASFSGTVTISDPTAGNTTLSFPGLSAAESAPLLAGAKAIFQARADALSAQLAAL